MTIRTHGGGAMPSPKTVRTSLGPVECIDHGEGPAILALHGGMGGCDQSWLLARALLPDIGSHRVVAVSRPGYLGTPLALAETAEEQADLLAALLDTLGIRDAAVAAVSAGGPPALHFAVRHPGRCRGLVLVSAASGRMEVSAERFRRMRTMALLARIPGVTALLRRKLAADPGKARARSIPDAGLRARTFADPDAGPLLAAVQESILDGLNRRMPGTLNDTRRLDTLPVPPLAAVRAPVLAVHAMDDDVVAIAHAEAVAAGVPGARLMRIDGGGHFCLFTHMHAVRDAAAAYLR
ncbi:MAG TPA: alpha/beta hydrolase [Azospirillaceae bacterium]|nr:alpha/beta hydrolase [Azospirillaceae bacterium]